MHDINLLLYDQIKRYPESETQDLVKLIYQKNFGCGHMLAVDVDYAKDILKEASQQDAPCKLKVECIGQFSRVYLPSPVNEFFCEALAKLFIKSSKTTGSMHDFLSDLDCLKQMAIKGELPIETCIALDFIERYKADGCPMVRHSQRYRDLYIPAYRVIENRYVELISVLSRLEQLLNDNERVFMAIEGRSATGKTDLSNLLSELYRCNIVRTDHFFLPQEMRTAERLLEPGGNVHYERMKEEVSNHLSDELGFSYHIFDCSRGDYFGENRLKTNRLTVVEGVYSMHPKVDIDYQITVFIETDLNTRMRRIEKRDGIEMAKRFKEEWIPMEDKYFEHYDIKSRCDFIVVT